MATNLPEKRIKKIKLPGDVSGDKTYEIIPDKLQSNNFQATLPTLTEDSTIALTSDISQYVSITADLTSIATTPATGTFTAAEQAILLASDKNYIQVNQTNASGMTVNLLSCQRDIQSSTSGQLTYEQVIMDRDSSENPPITSLISITCDVVISSGTGTWTLKAVAQTLGGAASKEFTTSVTSGSSDLVTSGAVYTAIDNLPEPMIFKGSVGSGGTVEWANLPSAASTNEGFTYKVITEHSTAPICKVGDTIISNGSSWVVIPSGDEPSGTVTSVGLSMPTGFTVTNSPVTSSGTLTAAFASGYSLLDSNNNQTIAGNKAFSGQVSLSGAGKFVNALGGSTYGIKIPDTSNYDTNKTFATTDDIPELATDVNQYGAYYVNPTKVRDYQTIFGIAPTLLTNINGHDLSSVYNTVDVTIGGYPGVKIRNASDNSNLSFNDSHNYMRKITGSNFTPIFGDGTVPQYSYIVGGDGTIYKPQWDATNGLVLYKVNKLALDSGVVHTSGNETIAGVKTFSNDIKINSANVSLSKDSSADRLYVNISGVPKLKVGANSTVFAGHLTPDSSNSYNLGQASLSWKDLQMTGIIKNGNVTYGISLPDMSTWSANKTLATTDDIPTTYLASASASGNTLTINPSNGSAITFTPSFTDHNQTVKVGSTTFGADTAVEFEGSGGTSVTTGTNKIIISSQNITVSSSTGVSDGTNTYKYTLPSDVVQDSSYAHITVTSTSVSDGTNTFNKYTHPTTTAVAAAAKKVGNDSTGHVVLGDALKDSDITNDQYVRYDINSQGLTDTQKSNARTNIGAGTSNFTGYTSSNKLSTDYINNVAGWSSFSGYTSSNKLSTDYINNVAGWTSNAGTVTSVATSGTGLSGGTITTSGTITLDSSSAGNRAANKVVLSYASGQINSDKFTVTSSGTAKATIQYDSTNECIKFVF